MPPVRVDASPASICRPSPNHTAETGLAGWAFASLRNRASARWIAANEAG